MTLKDQFDVLGYDSTLGYVGRALSPAKQDCILVEILKRLGAILVAKSNLPQSIMVSHACRLHLRTTVVVVHVNPNVCSGVRQRTHCLA
jgi:Asp-tRNA(Asn)/Glu-tRNA(Gln) amidotransferase A subunit family amidase